MRLLQLVLPLEDGEEPIPTLIPTASASGILMPEQEWGGDA